MTEEELKNWFWDKYNSCYIINQYNTNYMYYDINYIRAKKLANILNIDFDINIKYNTDNKLFEHDIEKKIISISDILLKYLRDNYVYKDILLETLIKNWFMEKNIYIRNVFYIFGYGK